MNLKNKKTKNFFEKLALFLANKFVFMSFMILCFIMAFLIFDFYVTRAIEKEFKINENTPTVNHNLYDEVISNWKDSKVEINTNNNFLEVEEVDDKKKEKENNNNEK